jgi:hypothetical protein
MASSFIRRIYNEVIIRKLIKKHIIKHRKQKIVIKWDFKPIIKTAKDLLKSPGGGD